ncbi:hypothetical protein [Parabacteroides sp.]
MKKNTIILAIVFMFAGCLTGNSQVYNDFDLKTFLVPDITRNALDFTLNSSGEMYDNKSSENDSYSITGDFGANFNRFKNSRSLWEKQNASISFGANYNKENASDSKVSRYNVSFSYSNRSRFYRRNNFFFGIGGNAWAGIKGDKQENSETLKNNGVNLDLSIPLSVGKGRIEVVTDARQAIYILENLDRRGVMKRKLSNDEILTLAKVIAQVKNKRFLDSRIHMIEEISTVDSFFVKNDLLTTNGAPYFTTLYDYWMYGDRFERLSGLVIEGTLTPGFQHYYSKSRRDMDSSSNSEWKSNTNIPSIKGAVSLTYENPVNLFWQQSGFVELFGQYLKNLYKYEDYNDSNNWYGGLNGSYKWGYYPTSRTNINLGVYESITMNSRKRDVEEAKVHSYFGTTTRLFFETYYYFSPQLRLSANAGIDYSYQKALKDWDDYTYSQFHPSFQFTLTYSLF